MINSFCLADSTRKGGEREREREGERERGRGGGGRKGERETGNFVIKHTYSTAAGLLSGTNSLSKIQTNVFELKASHLFSFKRKRGHKYITNALTYICVYGK